MAYHNGPKIVNSGLVFCGSGATTKSFRGESTTNLEANPISFSLWTSGATTTVTANTAFAPDGAFTATRAVTTGYWGSIISSPANSTVYTWSIYLRSTTGVNQSISCLFEDNGNYAGTFVSTTFTVTPAWQRFSITATTAAATNSPRFSIRNGDLFAWGIQLEQKNYASPFVVGTRGTTVATGGGLTDLSGNSNNGTLVGQPIYSSANGGSITFDGVDDYIDLGTSLASQFSAQTVTVETYAKISSVVSKNTLVSFNGAQSFFLPGNRLTTTYQLYWDGTGGWKNGNTSTWVTGQYYHFAWTISGTTLTFYVNGVADGTATVGVFAPTSSTRIGFANAGEYCTGTIGDLKIYNKALSAAEIRQNYNATKTRFGL